VLAALAAAVALVHPGGAAGDEPQLVGTVGTGDAFTISLAGPGGAAVTKLDPGTYTLLVHDNSSLHDFHLLGPGVDVATDVDGIGDRTFTITLVEGNYTFFCDPHLTTMRGSFVVGNPPPPPPTTTTKLKLSAAVGPGKKLSLSAKSAIAGDYRITVRDRSSSRNFHLVGPGVNRKTGKRFVGTATWDVTLKPGTYRYGSDPSLTGRLVVSQPPDGYE
jgi:hypothetical protein